MFPLSGFSTSAMTMDLPVFLHAIELEVGTKTRMRGALPL